MVNRIKKFFNRIKEEKRKYEEELQRQENFRLLVLEKSRKLYDGIEYYYGNGLIETYEFMFVVLS